MKTFIFSILIIIHSTILKSAQLKFEAYGIDEYFSYGLSENRQFLTYSNEGIFLTDIGVNGIAQCKGIIEIIDGTTSSNIMCVYTEDNGDRFFAQFFVKRGSGNRDATVQTFELVDGSGRWEEMVGQKCIGAYKPMLEKRFMWQGKCEMSDKTLDRVKSYIKPE